MPNYAYVCDKCGNQISLFLHITDDSARNSQQCQKCMGPMRLLISGGIGFQDMTTKTVGSMWDKKYHRDICECTPDALGIKKAELDKIRAKISDPTYRGRKKIMSFGKGARRGG